MVEKCSVNTSPIMALVVVGKKLGHFEYFCQKNKIKKQTQNIISIMAHILSAIKKNVIADTTYRYVYCMHCPNYSFFLDF